MNKVHNIKKDQRRLRHVLLKNQSDFCLACVLRPFMFFIAMQGATTVKSSCPHTDTNLSNNKCVYRQSTFYLLMCTLYMIGNLVLISRDVYEIRNNNDHISDFSEQILLQIIMCEVYAFVMLFCIAMNAQNKISEMNEITILLANCKIYGIPEMFSYENIRSLRRIIMISIIMGVLIQLLHFATCLQAYSVLESIVICLTFSTMLMCGIHMILESFVGKYLFATCYEQTKFVLNERLAKKQSLSDISTREMVHPGRIVNESMSILNKIQKLQRLYCAMVNVVELSNRYVNAFALVSIVALAVILAHQFYLAVRLWLAGEFSTNVYGMLFVSRFILIIIMLTVIFITNESMKNARDDILLYLEHFPIIKLLPQEATQVELLIIAMHTLQPEIIVADIVIFNFSLFGSIISSVVTYVLLALQFHIDWTGQ